MIAEGLQELAVLDLGSSTLFKPDQCIAILLLVSGKYLPRLLY